MSEVITQNAQAAATAALNLCGMVGDVSLDWSGGAAEAAHQVLWGIRHDVERLLETAEDATLTVHSAENSINEVAKTGTLLPFVMFWEAR